MCVRESDRVSCLGWSIVYLREKFRLFLKVLWLTHEYLTRLDKLEEAHHLPRNKERVRTTGWPIFFALSCCLQFKCATGCSLKFLKWSPSAWFDFPVSCRLLRAATSSDFVVFRPTWNRDRPPSWKLLEIDILSFNEGLLVEVGQFIYLGRIITMRPWNISKLYLSNF